jgi:hypothetical protein
MICIPHLYWCDQIMNNEMDEHVACLGDSRYLFIYLVWRPERESIGKREV